MELKNFIELVLVDIAEGITAAQNKVGDKIAINPASVDGERSVEKDYIAFDIAVTTSEQSKGNKGRSLKGGIKISVISAGIDGTKNESKKSNFEKFSRVNFRVPVYYAANFKKITKVQ